MRSAEPGGRLSDPTPGFAWQHQVQLKPNTWSTLRLQVVGRDAKMVVNDGNLRSV